jgi:hypothetical protein
MRRNSSTALLTAAGCASGSIGDSRGETAGTIRQQGDAHANNVEKFGAGDADDW